MNVGTDTRTLLWLGGAPCAGKSSVAEALSAAFDLQVYRVDDTYTGLTSSLNAVEYPALTKWMTSSWDERWMQPLETLLNDVIACYREHLSLVLIDLKTKGPTHRRILVEGSTLLPAELAPMLKDPRDAVWLIPTPMFQASQYAMRDWVKPVLAQCSVPDVAFANWMGRDAAFGRWLEAQVDKLGLATINIDGTATIDDVARAVAESFDLG